MPHRWRSGAMGCGVRAEGAMRGVGWARERAESSGAERGEGTGSLSSATPMVLRLWESR